VFNLAPGFPLDGGRVLRAVVWRVTGDHDRATRVAVTAGQGLALVLAAAGAYLVFFVREIGGLWWLAIAWFLYQAAAAALVQTRAFAALEGVAAGDVMTAVSLVVDAECSLEDFNTEFVLASRFTAFPVREEDRIRGLIGRQELRSVPRERWGSVPVGDVMQVLAPADVMDVTAPLEDVFRRIPHGESRVAIVKEGRFVGIVAEDELDRWARNSVSSALKPV
jgi:CBS domain-containing protein